MKETTQQLVDKATIIDSAMESLKKELNELHSKLQQEALKDMTNKKVKTVQYFGTKNNYILVTKASKVSLLDYDKIKEVFKDGIKTMVEKKDAYSLKKEFKIIADGIFKGDIEDKKVKEVLKEIGMSDMQIDLATKKLKLDYVKDKKLLQSIGLKDEDIETYIFFIHEAMIYEKINKALVEYKDDEDYKKAKEDIRKSVIVEETPKITLKYEK